MPIDKKELKTKNLHIKITEETKEILESLGGPTPAFEMLLNFYLDNSTSADDRAARKKEILGHSERPGG
tara:strand:+ start:37718 stop:37924 length:207 start_codon:yes stop_codon:yes gene_type:complete